MGIFLWIILRMITVKPYKSKSLQILKAFVLLKIRG
jgi:hypothetical protein